MPPRRQQRRLVQEVREISAGEAHRLPRQICQRHIFRQGFVLGMHLKNGNAATNIGFIEHHLAIKTPWTQQRRVKHIGPVGGSDDHHVGLLIKAIQLYQQLVERLLALIIAPRARIVALAANRVDFIDKDDTWRVLFGLLKKVAHSRRADAHEHLDKLRTADAVESDVRFTSHRARNERFACARRAHQQYAFGNTRPHRDKTRRKFQKFNNFLELHFRLLHTCHILKEDRWVRFLEAPGLGAPKRARLPAHAASFEEEEQHASHEGKKDHIHQHLRPLALLSIVNIDGNAITPEDFRHRLSIFLRSMIVLAFDINSNNIVSIDGHRG